MNSCDRAAAERLLPEISRETWQRLEAYVGLLEAWQKKINLISPGTLNEIWVRHVADSLQLIRCAPRSGRWADLGSGAGFPGLIIAAALADEPAAHVHLIESDQRKSAFLREVVRCLRLPASVHNRRIEAAAELLPSGIEVVTARALAPLSELLELAHPLLKTGAFGVFPKGRRAQQELTDAEVSWTLQVQAVPSLTDADSRILLVSAAEPRP